MASFASQSPLQPLSNGATSIAADEELLYTLEDVRITAAPQEGDSTPWGAGRLRVTSRRVLWEAPAHGFELLAKRVGLHAVTRDAATFPEPCLYVQLLLSDAAADDADVEPARVFGPGAQRKGALPVPRVAGAHVDDGQTVAESRALGRQRRRRRRLELVRRRKQEDAIRAGRGSGRRQQRRRAVAGVVGPRRVRRARPRRRGALLLARAGGPLLVPARVQRGREGALGGRREGARLRLREAYGRRAAPAAQLAAEI